VDGSEISSPTEPNGHAGYVKTLTLVFHFLVIFYSFCFYGLHVLRFLSIFAWFFYTSVVYDFFLWRFGPNLGSGLPLQGFVITLTGHTTPLEE